jgi:hypothetical protein
VTSFCCKTSIAWEEKKEKEVRDTTMAGTACRYVIGWAFASVVSTVMMFVVVLMQNAFQPSLQHDYAANAVMYRPHTDPRMPYMFLHPTVISLCMALHYALGKAVDDGPVARRALAYAATWSLMAGPVLAITWAMMNINCSLVMSWYVCGLFVTVAAGVTFSGVMRFESQQPHQEQSQPGPTGKRAT